MNDKTPEKSQLAQNEEKMLAKWKSEKILEKVLAARKDRPYFSFYDGPPFASGEPHYGHLEQTTVKDAIARYKTMRGFQVPRLTGWDTHGLPIEYQIEKELGLNSKRDIIGYGIDKFNEACKAIVFKHKKDFDHMYERMGRWNNPSETYATLSTDYMESVWWTLSEINKKGLLYRGFKSMPYCPRCETPLSNFELNDGYKDNVPDPSIFVLFPLTLESRQALQQRLGLDAEQGNGEERSETYSDVRRASTTADDAAVQQEGRRAAGSAGRQDDPAVSLLAWTTTPWTLPANVALAVDNNAEYSFVKLKSDGSTLILAKKRLDVLDLRKHDYTILKMVKGKELVGLRYEPLYRPAAGAKYTEEKLQNAWQVFHDDSVSLEDGTGILHVAPRYGETDLQLGLDKNLPLIESVDSAGHLIFGPEEALKTFFKKADSHIIADLTKKGRVFAAETVEHTYPFCWRCDTPLMYFATSTWFVAVSKIRKDLLKTAKEINWMPGHIKANRFGKWLEDARDWAISRNRYWGAPMPIWVNQDDPEDYLVISSISELEKLAGPSVKQQLTQNGALDLHRPFIDKISFQKDGKTYKRVEEVLDCWFESGSMPVAQWHYPFENKQKFDRSLPADFIVEAIEQVHLWFYTLHVISTILEQKPAYKNVIADGLILAADGRKLSKRLRNYPPIEVLLDKYGADTTRFFILSSPLMTGEDTRMADETFRDIYRNIFMTLENTHNFFKLYADLDKWQPFDPIQGKPTGLTEPTSSNILDQWILAYLESVTEEVTKQAENYRLSMAMRPLSRFVNDLSNWYVRRSRRRFWKSENDEDKNQAYATLHYVLVKTAQLFAPWAPFISDRLWRDLAAGTDLPESVHLSDWPQINNLDNSNQKLLENMKQIRLAIADGLWQRAQAKLKVRQPLAKVTINLNIDQQGRFSEIVAEELNVKEVVWGINYSDPVVLDILVTPELKAEGISRDIIRFVQNVRKNAGFNVEDRILLKLSSKSAEITEAIDKFKDAIFRETLATAELTGESEHTEIVQLDDAEITIALIRA